MIRRIAVALTFVCSLAIGQEDSVAGYAPNERDGLRLEVIAEVNEFGRHVSGEWKAERHFLRVQCLLKNVGTCSLIVATSTEDDGPSCWGGSSAMPMACFSIGTLMIEGKQVQVSPFRFSPVTLAPGEYAALPLYKVDVASSGEARQMEVIYRVDPVYAAKHGWWAGELRCIANVRIPERAEPLSPEQMKETEPNKPVETTSVTRSSIRESGSFAVAPRSASHG